MLAPKTLNALQLNLILDSTVEADRNRARIQVHTIL